MLLRNLPTLDFLNPHSAAVSLLRTVSDLQLILENIFNGNSMVCGDAGVEEAGSQRCKNVSCAVVVCLGKRFSPSTFEDAPLQGHLSEKRPPEINRNACFPDQNSSTCRLYVFCNWSISQPSQLPMSPSAGSSKCHAPHPR